MSFVAGNGRKVCLTEAIVQAYIDEELATRAMISALAHIDVCAKCKSVVNEAITEQQLVSAALAHELELPVPTVRLRARIERIINASAHVTNSFLVD